MPRHPASSLPSCGCPTSARGGASARRSLSGAPRPPATPRQARHPTRPVRVGAVERALVPALAWAGLLGRSGSGHWGAHLNSGVFHFLFDLV
jgi:hypothetical protein